MIGRLSAPIWLFLIGYARSRTIDRSLIGGAVILGVADVTLGLPIIPLTILWTIIIVRLVLDHVIRFIGASIDRLFLVTVAMAVLAPVTQITLEYGTMAVLIALCGHMARNGFGTRASMPLVYIVVLAILYAACQATAFPGFSLIQTIGVGIGTFVLWRGMTVMLVRPALACSIPIARTILMLGGRYSLEIYVGHLIAFKILWALIS